MQPSYAQQYPGQDDEQFRFLVDQAPFMMWSAGRDGQCSFFNQPWLEFRGRTMEEEKGTGWVEGVHSDDRQRCLDMYQRAFANHQPFAIEYRLRNANGEYSWIKDCGSPQFAKDGAFLGYVGSCVEIPAPGRATAVTPLTSREVQVLALVANGNSTKEVAGLLNISYKTADSHRSRIMEK